MSGDYRDLSPYRVEWRASLVTGWSARQDANTHDDALDEARRMVERHGGQARVVSQHVIGAEGLGAKL